MLKESESNNMQSTTHSHPPTLKIFFGTEMWERYGFYVVQTLLALYLALHFNWDDKRVYALVSSFTAITYLSPVVGGYIADHLLGQKRSIIAGAVILFISYIAIACSTTDKFLTASLAGVALGTGLLKPNISSLLGNEYPIGSSKRESGFTIFYMGITTGIILGTTIPSYLQEYFSWSVAFASASFGLVIAIIIFSFGIYHFSIKDYHPYKFQLKKIIYASLLMILLWITTYYILNFPKISDTAFITVVILSLAYLLYCVRFEHKIQAKKTMVILILCIISVTFWAFYFQMFLSLTLFIARVVEPNFLGIKFAPPYYVGIQSIGMIIFGLLITTRHKKKATKTQYEIMTGNKFIFAMILMSISYALITISCYLGPTSLLLSPLYIIPSYLIISLAELLLSPVGLSAITTLASPKKVSTMMGIFLVSLGIGGFLSGKLAKLTAMPIGRFSTSYLKMHYASSFLNLFYILLCATIICIVLNLIIKWLMSKPKSIIKKSY